MTTDDEVELVARLRAGDEQAFSTLVRQHHAAMVRLAATFVPNMAVAEEVVQDAWLGVVKGIERFEGRSSLKTWLFTIVANRARTTGVKEHRETPVDPSSPTVPLERFDAGGAWTDPPEPWTDRVDELLSAPVSRERIGECLASLPDSQRQVVTLRDVEGLTSKETCVALGISEANQRVLLHRGRAKVRGMLELEMGEG